MKFPSLKSNRRSFERTLRLDGGINTSVSSMLIDENEIYDCENMLYKDKMLKSRNGFFGDEDMILDTVTGYEYPKKPFEFLNESFIIDSKECKIGYTITWDVVSFAYVNTYLVFSDGTKKRIAPISFNRVDDTTFSVPESISVFKAEKKNGSGIFLFCHTKNYVPYSAEEGCRIYELTSDYTYWHRCFENEYYIPTIYYNGRGNLFSESAIADDPLYEKPKELESRNLLTGAFYSYFTADGSSDTFQLPLSDLDENSIICTLSYKNGEVYNWIISGSEAEIDFLTTKVTAKCNRKTGILSFYQDDRPYPLPLYVKGSNNNLKVLAYKKTPNGFLNVGTSVGALNYKSNIIVFGNTKNKNRVYTAKTNNPLYFPKDSFCEVGVSTEAVTAIKSFGDSLVAFTPSGIYSLRLSGGDLVASTEVISGVDVSFFKSDKITCTQLNSRVGCLYPESIKLIGDRLVFKDASNIYVMNKTGSIYSLSYPIMDNLEDEKAVKSAASFVYNGFYGVNLRGGIYLADIENMKHQNGKAECSWYFWSLPPTMAFCSAAEFSNKPIFCFSNLKEDIYYLSVLSGETDVSFEFSGEITEKIVHTVNSLFKTAFIDFDGIKIEKVILKCGAVGSIEIVVDNYYSSCKFNKKIGLTEKEFNDKILKKVAVYPSLKADRVSIKVVGKAPFYINELKYVYR